MADATFSLYIVRCRDDSLYTGIATDVKKRITEHESSPRGAKYLRGRGPLQLVFEESVGNRAIASRLESRVKSLSKAQKEDLIDGREVLRDLLKNQDSGEADCV